MNLEDLKKYVWLETYRQLKLFSLKHDQNMERMLADFAENGACD